MSGNVQYRCGGGSAGPTSWKGHSGGVPVSEMKVRSLVGLPTLHSVGDMRSAPHVVVRLTDQLSCGGYKWVSRLEAPCICTRCTNDRWMEQVSRLHGTAC